LYIPNAVVNFINNSQHASDFVWNFGNGNTSTISSPSVNYLLAGNYTISLVAINNICNNDTLILENYIQVLDTNTSVSSVVSPNELKFQVFPNPFSQNLQLVVPNSSKTPIIIKLYDVKGSLLFENTYSAYNEVISIEMEQLKLEYGNYLLHVMSNHQTYTFKLTHAAND
jgi:PKD repeat protein